MAIYMGTRHKNMITGMEEVAASVDICYGPTKRLIG
jgi:hypothetical protein